MKFGDSFLFSAGLNCIKGRLLSDAGPDLG